MFHISIINTCFVKFSFWETHYLRDLSARMPIQSLVCRLACPTVCRLPVYPRTGLPVFLCTCCCLLVSMLPASLKHLIFTCIFRNWCSHDTLCNKYSLRDPHHHKLLQVVQTNLLVEYTADFYSSLKTPETIIFTSVVVTRMIKLSTYH